MTVCGGMTRMPPRTCHSSAPFFVIPVLDTGIHPFYNHQKRRILT
ncbi:MAG: hypothetical protein ACEY3B_02780 [Wolbachia sp.]